MNDVINLLISNYDIGDVKEILKFNGGMGGSSYYVLSTKGEYVFKDIESSPMNHPENEYEILCCLRADGIPVPTVCLTHDGKELIQNDSKVYHLHTYIRGRIYNPNTAPDWLIGQAAVMLGKLQKSLAKISPLPVGLGKEFFDYMTPDKAIENHENTLKLAHDKGDKEVANMQAKKIDLIKRYSYIKFDFNKITYRNTHGDYTINQIVCSDRKINGVIDLTSACMHPVCWEVMRSYLTITPKCKEGIPDLGNLNRYIDDFLVFGEMNDYDIEIMPYLYLYQNLVPDYFYDYYFDKPSNKKKRYDYAISSFNQCLKISDM